MVLDTRKSHFVNQQWLQFHIWFIMTLYYKMRQILLQNETIILLQNVSDCFPQNATVLLQIATFITKCVKFTTKGNGYCKMRCLLQNASV